MDGGEAGLQESSVVRIDMDVGVGEFIILGICDEFGLGICDEFGLDCGRDWKKGFFSSGSWPAKIASNLACFGLFASACSMSYAFSVVSAIFITIDFM